MSDGKMFNSDMPVIKMDDYAPPCHITTGTLGSGYLHEVVKKPEGESLNEWIALNVDDIFKHVNKTYGLLQSFCTADACPAMVAGNYLYNWKGDDGKIIDVTAPQYCDHVLTWVQCQLDDDQTFPAELDMEFPERFMSVVKVIMARLFRIYAHVYHCHFTNMQQLSAEAHLNTAFKYFVYFSREFNLLSQEEMAPLAELINCIFAKNGH